jgi:hypothetical protein
MELVKLYLPICFWFPGAQIVTRDFSQPGWVVKVKVEPGADLLQPFKESVPLSSPFFQLSQKPYVAGSRSLRNNQLKAKLLRLFGQQSDLLLAMLGFVVFGAFVDVLLSVFDKPVEQTG